MNDGGPAFPPHDARNGMSLRDYFAAQVIQGMWSNHEYLIAVKTAAEKAGLSSDDRLAENAYFVADAMLSKRTTQTNR